MKHEPINDAYPLSPMQHGMLYSSLSARQPGVDIQQVLCLWHEAVDSAALERAWQRVAERHTVLRTSFRWNGSVKPSQEVHDGVSLQVHCKDWRDVPSSERRIAFETWLQSDRLRGFDLKTAPLMRVALFRLGAAQHQLVWTFHHLLLDMRGIVIVLNEVFAFYEAFQRGEELELPQPRPYRDHIEYLRQQNPAEAETFWRQTMKGFTAPTPLTVAHATREDVGETKEQEIQLSGAVTNALNSLAKKNNFTLNTVVQGAWALLLSRYSGEADVVFGAVRACRRSTVEDAKSIAGLFINTLPVRVRVNPELPLLPWLAELRQTWTALRPFEHTPLASIQDWSDLPGDTPPFASLVNFQNQRWTADLSPDGPVARREFSIRQHTNLPLALDASGGDELVLKIHYHRNRFDDESITRMLGHLQTLLEGVVSNPRQLLGELPLLTEAERQLFSVWNDTAAAHPKQKCVHELFAEQAARTPDALAVADEKQRLTYRELDERADQFAQRLQTLGVGPEICVAVCLERSVEMVVALLAVLKSGGAYVPLDSAHPKERLAFVLEDSLAQVLVTQESLQADFKFDIPNLRVLCLDAFDHASHITHQAANPQSATRNPQRSDLAYVIYTSGSTGTPKGVEIEHASLVNLIQWHQRTYSVTPADRATQLANPAFDASVWELWPYLTAGACIYIPDNETARLPAKLISWLAANKITLTFIPTPLAEAMLVEPWPEHCTLRALLTGGDQLRRPPTENLPCPLFNHYGPTENTVVTTWTAIPPAAQVVAAPAIGRPINNNRVHVLDCRLQHVPIGVPGELHISGDGLARGYRNRPEFTAERFILNPFGRSADSLVRESPGSRGQSCPRSDAMLYKTGDLVRWLPDGNLEFIGRMDHQVKIRGNRVELGEIESVLSRHPSVREAVVAARAGALETRLIAWVVPQSGAKLETKLLREFLKQHLPDYMLPAEFVCLDALPLTANGKIDRQALPDPTPQVEKEFTAPRTSVEARLAGIWREVLDLKRVSVHANFFELGGHSLLAARVVSRARDEFDREFPLHDLFDSPTIAGWAEKIEANGSSSHHTRNGAAKSPRAQITRGARNGAGPLSFAQERLWFLEQLEPGIAFNNIPLAFRVTGKLNTAALEQALQEIIRRHEPFRTTFTAANGRPVALAVPSPKFSVQKRDLSGLPTGEREAEAQRLIADEAQRPFDLTRDLLLRATLLRLSPAEHLLLLTTHHLACDGWSLDVFHRELAALYEAFALGRPSPLAALPIAYGDFAAWQRDALRGADFERQLAYWRQQLNGASPALDLPTDRPRPPVQTYRGAAIHFALPATLPAELAQLSRKANVTPFMLLLAAFQTLLHRYSGQADILVGSPIAGRARVETEDLIGFFLNTLVLRGDLSGDPTFHELLRRTRQTALDAYVHQDVPFEKIAEAVQPNRDLSRSPLFQVMFVLQNEPLRPLELAGLKVSALPAHSGTAKFDLTLSLTETPDGLVGFMEYNRDLFDAATITRMLGNFETLLASVIAHPEQRLLELRLLTANERRQLLVEWNDTRTEFSSDKCIHELFEAQVERTPDSVALVFEDEEITYRDLNRRADAVARELQTMGVGADVRVAICVERSVEMMVGLLGILKAGGAYVPLDPTYPKERLAFMLKDSQAQVLVTQESLQADFKFVSPNLSVLCLDAFNHATRNTQHASNPQSTIRNPQSSDLAYVIYTSGSTGKPKGVMVTHRNVVNFFAGMDRVLGTEPGVWLAVTSISFDISVLELFWTLTRGCKVIIHREPDPNRSRNGQAHREFKKANGQWRSMSDQILRHGVTHMQCTPSLAGTLLLAPESHEAMRRLSKLLLGGESLPSTLVGQLRRVFSGELLNMYGPTETTIWSATHRVDGTDGAIPIGRPIANTQIYILDQQLQPVPVGVPGELFIGGEGVARGYLNRPELTAEKFIPHPFASELAAQPSGMSPRLYRTGDLARYRADGTIEFLGRTDSQVKIRGHRIELAEIEAVLARHPDVREAVVIAREVALGDQRLVAYHVAANGHVATATELREFLKQELPDPMVPAAFVSLDKLPLTPNGKVDRKALPDPEDIRVSLDTAYVAPRTEMEKAIVTIWCALLRVERVGLHDNFFDLGGHSLLVVQVQARLRDSLGMDLPIVRLFQYPTIGALTKFLSEREETTPFKKVHDRAKRQRAAFAPRREEEVSA
ncbi:MAG: amino acid adenylation domain-containing protein [Verrucomicrobia bacterium]|nr:amino acid adenylation domain-containing protein [Verrucomicrobiota bacterium]